ncbi:MAG: ATP-binding cassette domain-containing protein [Spirochaetes bacterium]|nr:ATP-binding cassette domain-containing protein [Spirochaetota bacterium]MBU0956029.1 ATP-binding cassette domain-containing protein [Spirochaetota bacterium]
MPEARRNQAPALELKEVFYSSGDYLILDDIRVLFPAGQCSVILGQAGSGKSSLLKAAAGLVIPQRGQILVAGQRLLNFNFRQEQDFRASSGFVFQDSALWQDTTILNNVAMPLRVHNPKLDQKTVYNTVSAILRKVGYSEDMMLRPADLSTGEQKLVSIARAIVHEPALLLMDDPVSALDEDAADHISSILEELKKKGTTIVIATNNSELAYRHADNLGVIKNGRILAFGCYDDVLGKVEFALSGSMARLLARGKRSGCADHLPDIDNPEIMESPQAGQRSTT